MEEPNILNIPAFKRKRSLSLKARKIEEKNLKRSYPKKPRTRTRQKRKYIIEEEPLTDIPIKTLFPSQEIFEEPMLEISKKAEKNFREMKTCGICDGYFDKIEVAVIKVTSPIREGARLIFEKEDGLFEQVIESMQINRRNVSIAHSGDDIGIKVLMKPKVGTTVYKVID